MPDREPADRLGVVHDRYDLLEIVGSGGMGVVHRARDRVLNRTVALKMIRAELAGPEFVRRFEREAEILARLRSPHIVVVYDYGQHEGQFFMVTDYLVDGDLADWLETHGPMPVGDAVTLVALLAEGLADAHDAGVLHRDIKPANVLLWRRGERLRPVLADFGIAVTSDLTLTKTGAIVGSPLYMAPERHLGEAASVASDLYSMGCLLYALLTGDPPFWGGTEFQAATAHLNNAVPTVPVDLPYADEVDAVIAACMAKAPADRLASAEQLAQRLHALALRIAPPVPVPEPASDPVPSRRSSIGATTVLSPTEPPPPGDGSDVAAVRASDDATGASHSGDARRRGRAMVAALVAAVVVVVVAAAALWVVRRDGDPSSDRAGALDPTGPPTSDATSEVAVVEETLSPRPPGEPEVSVESGYRTVRFEAAPPQADGVDYTVEQRRADTWAPVARTLKVPTVQGGDRVCVTLRVVATNDGGRSAGPAQRFCGRSEQRTVEIRGNPAECVTSAGGPCVYVDVVLTGFAPGRPVAVVLTQSVASGEDETGQKFVTVDDRGYGLLGSHREGDVFYGGGFKTDPDAERIVVTVDGISDTRDLDPTG